MKVLITGAAGFIGFHLSKALLNLGVEVIGIDNLNDYYSLELKKSRLNLLKEACKELKINFHFHKEFLENKDKIDDIFKRYNPDVVVNLAAQAGVRYSITNPNSYIQSNLVGFGNILESSRKQEIKNLIYASSSSVYGGNEKFPFNENDTVDHPVSLYAATKKANELMAHTYSHLYNIPTIGLRFFTVYGPWGRPDMALFLFTKSILSGKPIKVFNHGDMIRDFTYIDDIIKSIICLIKKPAIEDNNFDKSNPNSSSSWAPFRIFNIGNSKPISLMTYINTIEDELGIKAKKDFFPMQPGDVRETVSDCDALEAWTGIKPNTEIKYGIKKFLEWYKYYYNC